MEGIFLHPPFSTEKKFLLSKARLLGRRRKLAHKGLYMGKRVVVQACREGKWGIAKEESDLTIEPSLTFNQFFSFE